MSDNDPTCVERTRRFKLGLATRLDAIQAEQAAQAERDARIERALAELTARLDKEQPQAARSQNRP